jgi:TonB family protein
MQLTDVLARAGSFPALALIALTCAVPAANAQNFVIDLEAQNPGANALDQPLPEYPGGNVRSGQEGWVRMSYVVTGDGRAIDPIIIDSSGGDSFEREAIRVMPRWRFEQTGVEHPYNLVDLRFEIYRGRDMATSNFIRRYRRIVTHLHHEENDVARKQVDETARLGGWNLYESVMLWLMVGRVEGVEGKSTEKLESYRRALGISNKQSLWGEDKAELLRKIFELELEHGQHAAAAATLAQLKRVPGNEEELKLLVDSISELERKLAGGDALVARGKLYNPCNCAQGSPVWNYSPARRVFSFENVDQGVERFEARCVSGRISDAVEPGKSVLLPDDWGKCRVFVFGSDGAGFDFREHDVKDSVVVDDDATVARSNVLD